MELSSSSGTVAVAVAAVIDEYRGQVALLAGDALLDVREVVARRYSRLVNEGKPLPDLILIDGGKGQLSAALGVLEALGRPLRRNALWRAGLCVFTYT